MQKQLIAPAALIFLCGIGVGFSLFPHLSPTMQSVTPAAQPIIAAEIAPPATISHEEAALDIPPIPEEKPLTGSDQEAFVLQLFSPTSSEVSTMQSESEQSKMLEQTLMMSYLLSNCGIMKYDEYERTYMALVKYLTNNGATDPQIAVREAASRAKASYQMVYRHAPCEDQSLYKMAASLAEWRDNILPPETKR